MRNSIAFQYYVFILKTKLWQTKKFISLNTERNIFLNVDVQIIFQNNCFSLIAFSVVYLNQQMQFTSASFEDSNRRTHHITSGGCRLLMPIVKLDPSWRCLQVSANEMNNCNCSISHLYTTRHTKRPTVFTMFKNDYIKCMQCILA